MPLFRASPSGSGKGGPRKRKVKYPGRRERGCGSLARLCLWSLAENMKDVWTKDYTQNYMDQYCFRYIMGPFNMLPGHLVEELLSLLSSRHLLTRGALHLLLLPQLRRLSMASCSGLASPGLCQLIGVRCSSLQCLDLSGAQQLCSSVLCDLVRCLPDLRSLSLAGTPCDGRVVETAAASCPSLQRLDVSRCHRLAPAGLLPLAHRPGVGYTGLGLRALQALDIGFGEEEGERAWVAAFLLLALPLLTSAALEDLGEACRIIAGRDFDSAQGNGFGVPELREVWGRRVRAEIRGEEEEEEEEEGREDLLEGGWAAGESEDEDEEEAEAGEAAARRSGGRDAALVCGEGGGHAETQALTLSLQEAQGVAWGALKALGQVCPRLRSLALCGEEGPGCHGARVMGQWAGQLHNLALQLDGVLRESLPIIQAVGSSLTSLTLEGVRLDGNASFLQLIRSCPKLKTLHVHAEPRGDADEQEEEEEEEEEEDVEANLRDVPRLPLLHSLKLNFLLDQRQKRPVMSWRALKWALMGLLGGSPLLEKVSLSAVPCGLDEVFHRVLCSPREPSQPAPLQRLHHLSLTRCDISQVTISTLVSRIDCLSFLDLTGCWSLSLVCLDQLEWQAIRRRNPLNVVWA